MTHFIDGLELAGYAGAGAAKTAAQHGEAAESGVLQRCNTLHPDLHGIHVPCIGYVQLAVVLGKTVKDGVQFPFLLRLVFPVSVHGETERVLPLVPVLDLYTLVLVVGEYVIHGLVGGLPIQSSGHKLVFLSQIKASGFSCHRMFLLNFPGTDLSMPPHVVSGGLSPCLGLDIPL